MHVLPTDCTHSGCLNAYLHAPAHAANEVRWVRQQLQLLAGEYWRVYPAACGVQYDAPSRNTFRRAQLGAMNSKSVTVGKLEHKYATMTSAFDADRGAAGSAAALCDTSRPTGEQTSLSVRY